MVRDLREQFLEKINKVIIIVLFTFLNFIFIWNTRLLRPAADDYCLASFSGNGIFLGLKTWYVNNGGELFAVFSNFLFVGQPLLHFKWSLASAVPFLLIFFIVAAFSYFLMTAIVSKDKSSQGSFYVILPFVPIVFLGYWLLPTANNSEDLLVYANAVSFWQGNNYQYIFSTITLIYSWFHLFISKLNLVYKSSFALVLGVISGLWGYVIAASVLAAILITVFNITLTTPIKKFWNYRWLFFGVIGLISGLVFSLSAPGTQKRRDSIQQLLGEKEIHFFEVVKATFPNAFTYLLNQLSFVSIFFVLFSGLILGFTLKFRSTHSTKYQMRVSIYLFGFSVLIGTISYAAELFAYRAFWHFISSKTVLFFGILLFGFTLGQWIKFKAEGRFFLPNLILTGVLFLSSLTAVLLFESSAQERLNRWNIGEAGVPGASDIGENDGGWQLQCWLDISNYREIPARS